MTREEAIEIVETAFNEWENEFFVSGDDWSKEHEALDMAIEALKNKPRWIPVSERLPEEGETVLVCYQTQGGATQSVSEWFNMPNRGVTWSTLCGQKPIAWMPLPEPYTESEVADETNN